MIPRVIQLVVSLFSDDDESQVSSMSSESTMATRGGRPVGTGNCDETETMALLDCFAEFLPVGEEEHRRMHERFLSMGHNRSLDSMKRKFGTLHRAQIPTGDPNCPPDARGLV